MKVDMGIDEIKSYLPHRDPFLFVDKVIYLEEMKITGVKNVTHDEPFFKGHFPGHPVMPGVLIIEALAQTCGILALKREENRGKLAYFVSIKNAKFRKPVFPGDTLLLEIEVIRHKPRIVHARGVAKVGDSIAAEADLLFAIVEKEK